MYASASRTWWSVPDFGGDQSDGIRYPSQRLRGWLQCRIAGTEISSSVCRDDAILLAWTLLKALSGGSEDWKCESIHSVSLRAFKLLSVLKKVRIYVSLVSWQLIDYVEPK